MGGREREGHSEGLEDEGRVRVEGEYTVVGEVVGVQSQWDKKSGGFGSMRDIPSGLEVGGGLV